MMPLRAVLAIALIGLCGCTPWAVRSQSPEEDLEALMDSPDLVGDLAVATGTSPVRVEAVSLVTGLEGTGGDPPPSHQRAALISEMQTRGVPHPNRVLESRDTAIVLVRAYLRPGIQKGDRFDIEIRSPSGASTTSLRNGWLMETRLKELQIINDTIHDGHVLALAEGPLLVDPGAKAKDGENVLRARVLSGGVALKSRPLGLVLKPDHRTVRNSALIGKVLDRRFHTYTAGIKMGVAKPKTDEYIELAMHPRYKDNLERYLDVVRSVPLSESAAERLERIEVLERQLLDPVSAKTAALRLEAIGREAIETLRKGLDVADPEVHFYSAEALAYLDDRTACPMLADVAKNEPAFRVYALTALSSMEDVAAFEALSSLLDVPSAETRYGAFRALWAMDASHPLVKGDDLDGKFHLHVLDSAGPPMIHLTRSYRAEVVLFGHGARFELPVVIEAGKHILIKGESGGDVLTISRFAVDEPDQKRQVSPNVEEVIRAVVELGGTYPDVVEMLMAARGKRALNCRVEVDALPQGGRTYDRSWPSFDEESSPEEGSGDGLDTLAATAESGAEVAPVEDRRKLPLLYRGGEDWNESDDSDGSDQAFDQEEPEKPRRPWEGLFGRIGKKRPG
ncbi:MAG: flagellar basal body P-ring protein FlgI [Pirellulales bacterium]|nr:flagellar basal body P-ring protein FlgI [Pirellulales bacterium]